jgi:hypothetical protein
MSNKNKKNAAISAHHPPPIQPVQAYATYVKHLSSTNVVSSNHAQTLLQKGIVVIDNFLNKAEVLTCRNELKRFKFVSTRQPKSIRTDCIAWLHENMFPNAETDQFLPTLVQKLKGVGCLFEKVLGKLEAPSRCMVSVYKNVHILNDKVNGNNERNSSIIADATDVADNSSNNGYRAHLVVMEK